jgi:hypothetical protein
MTDLEFTFGNNVVGTFEETSYPRTPGRYHYMPYRGPGHFDMQESLKLNGKAKCHFGTEQERISFSVVSCPEYGILQLENFESEKRTKA